MRGVWLLLLTMLVALTAWSAITRVEPGERAVVRRFGRILPNKPGPGLYVGLPWGFDRVDRVPVSRVRSVLVGLGEISDEDLRDTPAGQMLTGDHNLVDVQVEIQYTVFEDQVDKYVLQADRADALVARATEAALAEWIAGRKVDDVLLDGKTLLPRFLVQRVQHKLENGGYELGVKIEQANLKELYPPAEVKDAFDRLAQAETDNRTLVNRAEQEADRQGRASEARAFQIKSQAAAYAREQQLSAKGDAETFLIRLNKYRELAARDPNYLNTLWQDDMTRLYARMRETGRLDVLDSFLSSEGLNISQFPLAPKKK
jgi:membrane protease subunit HflK